MQLSKELLVQRLWIIFKQQNSIKFKSVVPTIVAYESLFMLVTKIGSSEGEFCEFKSILTLIGSSQFATKIDNIRYCSYKIIKQS